MEIPFPYYFLIVLGQKGQRNVTGLGMYDWIIGRGVPKKPFIKENSQLIWF